MNKLQTRLIISFTFVILVILFGVSTIFSILIIRFPQQERLTYLELNTQARSIITILRRLPNFDPSKVTRLTLLEDLSQRHEIRIAWATADHHIIFDSAHLWDTEPGFDLFAKLTPNVDQRWTGQIRDSGRIWLIVAHPMIEPTNARHFLILAKPITRPVLNTLMQLRETIATPLLQAGIIALTIGIMLSIAISRSIAKPLATISQAALALADGDYEVRVSTEGPQEIKDLTVIFNKMAQQIQASHQAQNDLVANVAHDLRTPLTSIQGYAQALLDGTADEPASRDQAAQTIYEESRRMQEMTKSLLDLARFQAGEIKLHLTAVDIIKLADVRIDFYQKQVHDAGLTLALHTTHKPIIVQADKERLIQVLDNLLNNAIANTRTGGKVTVAPTISDSWAKIAITDTGIGIPQNELPRIFERFYRGDKSRRGAGTGLGLSIVKEIITAHNGTIEVESIVGVGSKFTVSLPIDQPSIT